MGYWLKKVVEYWLMPVPLVIVLLALAAWTLHRARAPRPARMLLSVVLAYLVLGSNIWFSTELVRGLEWRYPPVPALEPGDAAPAELSACRYVVVLGAGHADATQLAALDRLSPSALARLAEGIRILRHLPGARLILSGPAAPHGATHASVLAAAAESLGVPRQRMILIDSAYDTAAEAVAVRMRAGEGPIALVTSAVHMPRAVALFRHQGIALVACPADYTAKPSARFELSDLKCDTESLARTTTAVRERLGAWWARLRGQAD